MGKKVIHVTTLGQFNSCPHAWNINKNNPIPFEMTYKGDLLNLAVSGDGDLEPFLKWYADNISYDFKEHEMFRKIFVKARERLAEVKKNFKQVYQEAKMIYRYNEDVAIVGTPDIFFYDEELKLWKIRDWKMSTHSWYGNEEVTKYEMQKPLYSLMVMDMFGVDRAEFKYWCYDKKTGALGQFGKIITRTEAKALADDCIKRYLEAEEWEDYQCRANSKCKGMCDINKRGECPLFKREMKSIEDDNEF